MLSPRRISQGTGTCCKVRSKQHRRSRHRPTVNGPFHIGVAVVQVTQRLVLAFNGLNLYGTIGVLQTLLVALQNVREVAKKNLNKLMGKNSGSGIEIRLVVFNSLRNDFRDASEAMLVKPSGDLHHIEPACAANERALAPFF